MSIFVQFFRRLRRTGLQVSRSELWPILSLTLLTLGTGTFVYARLENWTFLESLYFTIITMTTVGYGDLAPQSNTSRWFTIGFTLVAIGIGGYAISTFAAYTIEGRQKRHNKKLRRLRMEQIQALKDHYIVCGADMFGMRIAEEFYSASVSFIVVDDDEDRLKSCLLYSHPAYFQQKLQSLIDFREIDLSEYEDRSLPELSRLLGTPYILDDPTDDAILLKAGIERAAGLVAVTNDDRDNLSIVIGARNLATRAGNTDLKIMSRVEDSRYMRKLYLAGADFVRIPAVVSGTEMAAHILNPEMGHWWYDHLHGGERVSGLFKQVNLKDRQEWVGKPVMDIYVAHKMMVLSITREGKILSPPPHDLTLQTDDIAIVLG